MFTTNRFLKINAPARLTVYGETSGIHFVMMRFYGSTQKDI